MHIEIFATLEANWGIQKNKKKKKNSVMLL